MTRRRVADDQYGQLKRRLDEIARRTDEGSIPFANTMLRLQQIAENCTPTIYQLYQPPQTVAELLAKGNYDNIDKGVERVVNRSVNREQFRDFYQFRIEFVPFDLSMETETFFRSQQECGLKRLSLVHALMFGMHHPEVQRYHTLHFVPDPLPWVEAADMDINHFSNFTAEKSGRRYFRLDGRAEDGGYRSIQLVPLYDAATSRPYDERDWFGFRRDLPQYLR